MKNRPQAPKAPVVTVYRTVHRNPATGATTFSYTGFDAGQRWEMAEALALEGARKGTVRIKTVGDQP